MTAAQRKDEIEARKQLSDLLDAAESGQSTIITRRGRAIAVLMPIESYGATLQQHSLLPLEGSGRGLWRKDSTLTLRRLRDEWSR